MSHYPEIIRTTCQIDNGASLSDSVDLRGKHIVGVGGPAGWTAAGISFEGSMDDANFYEVGNGAAEITLVFAAGWFVSIPPGTLEGAGRYIKLRSGTSAVPVNQGDDRVITVWIRP